MKIVVDKKIAGYFVMMEYEKSFNENDRKVFSLLCDIIASEMQKRKFFQNSKGYIYESFITDILDGKEIEQAAMNDRINYLIKNFVDYLKKNNMHAGISRCFHNLIHLQEYYLQSVKSLEYGMLLAKQKPLYFYEEFTIYHLFDICQSKKRLDTFCHDAIFALIQHDRNHHTNYMKTLFTYINNEKKILETANALQIHRNTLTSRIEAIEEIMSIDLNDVDITFHLYLTFKILRFTQPADFEF